MSYFRDHYDSFRWPIADDKGVGFRQPQAGALHAIAAHFSQQSSPGVVTMPTGSGKTAVLCAAPFVLRATRVLIVAPSRLLREQIVEDIQQLRVLRLLGAVGLKFPLPKVASVRQRLTTTGQWAALSDFDVVVGIPSSMNPELEDVAEPPADLFDMVLIDEAHHSPARSWKALLNHFAAARQVLFTATPFRRDRRELGGKFVYTYELRDAYRDGVFGRLEFTPVDVAPGEDVDRRIAEKAEQVLRADLRAGLDHRLMVRTGTRTRAAELAELYSAGTTLRLETVLGSHSLRHVKQVLDRLKSGESEGIICVDMLGEGFDLPTLKVAALHTPHKSLAVTLQFIGRFARTTGPRLGRATFVAAASDMEVERERLYRQGAAWDEIIPNLSAARVAEERETQEVLETFVPPENIMSATDELADLSLHTLKPYHHVKIFRGGPDVDVLVPIAFPGGLQVVFQRFSPESRAAIYITRRTSRPDWTTVDKFDGVSHDLYVIHHHEESGLVFVCASHRVDQVYDHFAIALAPDGSPPLRGLSQKKLNQVLLDLEAPRFFNVGKKNALASNLAVSYETITGPNADEDIGKSDARAFRRGHWFCSAKSGGVDITIGLSTMSKVWSNTSTRIAQLISWCDSLAQKIVSRRVPATRTGLDFLSTGEEATQIPDRVVYATWHRSAFDDPIAVSWMSHDGPQGKVQLLDLDLRIDGTNDHEIHFALVGDGLEYLATFSFATADLVVPRAGSNVLLTVDGGVEHGVDLAKWMSNRPPMFHTADFATLDQFTLYATHLEGESPFDAARFEVRDWAAAGVDIQLEFGAPTERGVSIHAFVESELAADAADVIFYDHGSGEVADFVTLTISADHVRVKLYHCKASGGPAAGSRVEDAYDVCGQVAKSTVWTDRRLLLRTIRRRFQSRQGGSRFLKGTMAQVEDALGDGRPKRLAVEIIAVQPGLSAAGLNDRVGSVLAAADDFIFGGPAGRLRVIGSA